MVKTKTYLVPFFFLLVLLATITVRAQNIDAFARVAVSPRDGVVRQAYKVTITVHSSTWFAQPLNFANLSIENAFIIPFTRTLSSINYINNKKYATLSFYYLVFPYESGEMIIPELEINTSIPPEGDYKGQPVTIKTKKQTIRVKPIPKTEETDLWMVAKNVQLSESWSKPLENLKVGDVIERQILISASGTLPSLIQPLEVQKPENTSIYEQQAELKDKRNNEDANGDRIEHYSYLFENEGEVIIPEEEVLWWNPTTNKVYKRTLPEHKLSIAANPDLAMMKSLKDSLLALSGPVQTETVEKTFPWLRIAFFAVLLAFLFFLWKMLQKVIQKIKANKAAYRQSEAYYFKKVLQALNQNEPTEFIRALYIWFDKARKPEQNAAIYHYLHPDDKELLESVLQDPDKVISSEQQKYLLTLTQNLRNRVKSTNKEESIKYQLNPV